MTVSDFIAKLKYAASVKTLYVKGCFGAPMTESNKTRYINASTYNKNRAAMINAADSNTFGFDCVCLIKGILWGWTGDNTKIYGGASYTSNGVPDISEAGMINACPDASTDFSNIQAGEVVYMSGHIGVYIGDGQVIECTPSWSNNVQYSWLGNLSQYKKDHYRIWTKHGHIPYVDYSASPEPTPTGEWTVLDISRYQTNITYSAAASSVKGVIMRVGYRGNSDGTLSKDSMIDTHYNGFQSLTKVGFYFFSQAINEAEGRAEADYVYSIIKSWRCDFPVYIDSENSNSGRTGRADNLDVATRTAAVCGFCNRMIELGYRAGVYASESWFKSNLNFTTLVNNGYSIWCAKYSTNKPTVSKYDGWQYTSSGSISGYGSNVDLSHFYVDVAGWGDGPITSNDVNDYELTVSVRTREFNWELQEPVFTLGNLVKGTDYDTNSLNNRNAGTITCYISGINRYTGARTFQWTITPRSISALAMTLDNGGVFTYTGSPIRPTGIRTFDQYLGGRDLTEGTDYDLVLENNVNVGQANINAVGKGNFKDTLYGHFTIVAQALNMNSFYLEANAYEYTGKQICPRVYNSSGYVENTAYNVVYGGNIEGTGTVTITGIGNYSGSRTLTFTINKTVDPHIVADISSYEESFTSYNTFANNVDGVVIRAGYRGYGSAGTLMTDTKVNTHYYGLLGKSKLGFYFGTQAISESEAYAEADYVYNIIKSWRCDFPVYVYSAYGNSSQTGRADSLTRDVRTNIVLAFCARIKAYGYRAGVMAADSWFGTNLNVSAFVNDTSLSLWVLKDGEEKPTIVTRYDAWRYTTAGNVPGYSGRVDLTRFYADVADWDSSVPKPDVSEFEITLSNTSFTYTGSAIVPEVTVGNLIQGEDYRLAFNNNINAGTASVTITGINNYTGLVTRSYTIHPKSIAGMEVDLPYSSTVYTGTSIRPTVRMTGLTTDDYGVTYANNINVGTATVTATGKGNYTGTAVGTFEITQAGVDMASVFSLEADEYKYTGYNIQPPVRCSAAMALGTDYELTYGENIHVGTGTVTVTCKGNYSGTITFEFIISMMRLEEHEISLDPPTFTYDGTPKRPKVIISGGLVENRDFTVVYYSNINAGEASVTATGINTYEGELSTTFTINRQSIESRDFIVESPVYYNTKPYEPRVSIPGLYKNTDYTVSYLNNTLPGIASVVALGTGNYTGSITKEFEILIKPIEDCIAKFGYASVKTIYRIYDGEDIKIYTDDTEKYQLTEMIDYEKTNEYTVAHEDFTLWNFTIKGIGAVSGEMTYRFRIIPTEPSEPIDYEDDGVYNFGDIDLEDETAFGDYDFGDLDEGIDPESVAEGDYDFDALSGMRIADYDDDDGTNIDEDGNDKREEPDPTPEDDDGKFNFGDLDLHDETAEGDYDFGDLDEGIDPESVAKEDYDFNKLSGDPEDWLVPGTDFELLNTPLYETYSSTAAFTTRTGTYFVYSAEVMNGRVRMCRTDGAVLSPAKSAGWATTEDLINLGEIVMNDLVKVSGVLKEYASGAGGSIDKDGEIMYVRALMGDSYDCPYGLANAPRGTVIGYASEDQLTKVDIASL